MNEIKSFDGEFSFLSNFANSNFIFDNREWKTVEHAFQAMKTLNLNEQEAIRKLETPGQSKRAGRKVTLRSDWEQVKVSIMEELVTEKFKQSKFFKSKLLATGDAHLEEGNNWHDCEWGVCNCPSHQGVGKNKLGTILMRVRNKLKEGK